MTTSIKHVFGNPMRLIIPLIEVARSVEGGQESESQSSFIPSDEHPVKVVL